MTQTFKSPRKIISGDGWSNPLTHDFRLENSAHLKLYADGTLLQLGVDYTLAEVGNPAGYQITITIPDPGDEPVWWGNELFILSVEPPIDQPADISVGGSFGEQFELALDALARRLQRVYDMALRAYKSPFETDPGVLDQDDLILDPGFIPDLLEASAAAVAAADSAEDDAEQTAADRASATASAGAAAASAASAAGNAATTTADRAAVAAARDAVESFHDEVEADRVEVQNNKVLSAQFATSASDSASAAQALYDLLLEFGDFNERFLGERASAPTAWDDTDPTNPGGSDPLVNGLVYYNTSDSQFYTYTGTGWRSGIDTADFLRKSQNLDDLPSKATARANLDVPSTTELAEFAGTASAKSTPILADSVVIVDSADGNEQKRLTFTNLKTWIETFTLASVAYADIAAGVIASTAEYLSNTASRLVNVASLWAAAAPVTLTDAATITANFNTFIDSECALAGDRTLGAPSNMKNGQKGVMHFTATTSTRILTLNAAYLLYSGVETGPYSVTTSQLLSIAYLVRGGSVYVTAVLRRG